MQLPHLSPMVLLQCHPSIHLASAMVLTTVLRSTAAWPFSSSTLASTRGWRFHLRVQRLWVAALHVGDSSFFTWWPPCSLPLPTLAAQAAANGATHLMMPTQPIRVAAAKMRGHATRRAARRGGHSPASGLAADGHSMRYGTAPAASTAGLTTGLARRPTARDAPTPTIVGRRPRRRRLTWRHTRRRRFDYGMRVTRTAGDGRKEGAKCIKT